MSDEIPLVPARPEAPRRWEGTTLILATLSGLALVFLYLPLAWIAFGYRSNAPVLVNIALALPLFSTACLALVWIGFHRGWRMPVLTLLAALPVIPVFVFLALGVLG